jgi:hypothetical protein
MILKRCFNTVLVCLFVSTVGHSKELERKSDADFLKEKKAPTTMDISAACTSGVEKIIGDFDNGSLQGWSGINAVNPSNGFNGTLSVEGSGGNPAGYLLAVDTAGAGGGPLTVLSPSTMRESLIGDLTRFELIKWDVLLPNLSGLTNSTSAWVKGADGTLFRSSGALSPFTPAGNWFSKSASFVSPNGWTRFSGSASYSSVMANAVAVYIDMDAVNGLGTEAGLDNIRVCTAPVEPVFSCPKASSIRLTVIAGGGFCEDAQAELEEINSNSVNYVNWSWLLETANGNQSGSITSGSTAPIYINGGHYNGDQMAVCAQAEASNGTSCDNVCANFVMNCDSINTQGGG